MREVIEILKTIRGETQPIDGHTDPGAIEDCWNEVFERLEESTSGIHDERIGFVSYKEIEDAVESAFKE